MGERSAASVIYRREPSIAVDEFRRVLVESGLGATRPVDDAARLQAMLDGANLIVKARLTGDEYRLVGVARCNTDFAWNCYLSELVVSGSAQGLGVGKGLMDTVRRELGPRVSLILASMPGAVGFYESLGMPRLHDAFWFKRTE